MSQRSYFESRLDTVTLGGVGGGNRKFRKTLRVRDRNETWWEEALGSSDLVTSAIWALGSCYLHKTNVT